MSLARVIEFAQRKGKGPRIKNVQDLVDLGVIEHKAAPAYKDIVQHYTLSVSEHVTEYLQQTSFNPEQSPIARQYIPDLREANITDDERSDPIGDDVHSPVKGIVHRYPDRVLLKITPICAVYCRYCFRREMTGPSQENLSTDDLSNALDYIRKNDRIWEVILTGGDPFVLSARRLSEVIDALNRIDHVRVIRFHTRVPIADPLKIDDTICSVLNKVKAALFIVLHVNHAEELNNSALDTIRKLLKTKAILLSQSVLLKGVNNDVQTLENLLRALVSYGVKPYYLHHPDLAKGTSHFRVSIEEGQKLMRDLQGRISGLCLPHYVLDIPGGYGKVPIGHNYIESDVSQGHSYKLEDYQGNFHYYPPRKLDKEGQ